MTFIEAKAFHEKDLIYCDIGHELCMLGILRIDAYHYQLGDDQTYRIQRAIDYYQLDIKDQADYL